MKYENKLWYKIVYYINIYKFELQHFLIRCIFFFLIEKNTIENPKYDFLTIICDNLKFSRIRNRSNSQNTKNTTKFGPKITFQNKQLFLFPVGVHGGEFCVPMEGDNF